MKTKEKIERLNRRNGQLANELKTHVSDLAEILQENGKLRVRLAKVEDVNNELREEIMDLESKEPSIEELLPKAYRNLRTVTALQTLIGNIQHLDITELEAFAQRQPLAHHQL